MAGKKKHIKDKDGKIIGAKYYTTKQGYTLVDMTNVDKAQKKVGAARAAAKKGVKAVKNVRKYHNNDYEEGK
jgi:hypothetical protein